MKTLSKIVLIGSSILLSSNAIAAKPLTQGQALGQCKALASTQFDNVVKTRVASIKSNRGIFKARLRVKAENDKGLFLCTIDRNQSAEIVRIDKKAEAVASN